MGSNGSKNQRSLKGVEVSVVIPTLNESAVVAKAIRSAKGPNCEIIVVDASSKDSTRVEARKAGANKIFHVSVAGRARQMNVGAKNAKGKILFFLHADSTLPSGWINDVKGSIDSGSMWGSYETIDIGNDVDATTSFIVRKTVGLRTRLLGKPYGDQGIFVNKDTFDTCGGFPNDWELLEDIRLVEKLKFSFGNGFIIPKPLQTSGRRWKELGWFKTTCINQIILFGYACGIHPNKLAAVYRQHRTKAERNERIGS